MTDNLTCHSSADAPAFQLVVHDPERRRGRLLAPAQAGGSTSSTGCLDNPDVQKVLGGVCCVAAGVAGALVAVGVVLGRGIAAGGRRTREAIKEDENKKEEQERKKNEEPES